MKTTKNKRNKQKNKKLNFPVLKSVSRIPKDLKKGENIKDHMKHMNE